MEVKGNLARLLATENLIVEHRQVETAMFNIKDRVLTLPMWDIASPNVYDMLVGHEVGHALYTPDEWGEDHQVPQSYLNVVEDARIEKMMKRKFPGLARNFYDAYQELHTQDFFEIGDRDMDSYTLIDRINLYFKIGLHAGMIIPFNEKEKTLSDMVSQAETFAQVVEAARQILAYTREQELEKIQADVNTDETTQSGGDSTEGQSEGQSQGQSEGQSQPEDADEQPDVSGAGSDIGGINNLESETNKAFSEKQRQLNSSHSRSIDYVEIPPLDLNTFVISNKQVMKDCSETYGEQCAELFTDADKQYLEFRSEAQREVNYLVKEFEMRKSADQYARSSTAKTGILDTQKLHTYKWNEDVFKKINIVPDGKNHGMIFILDWSGSMGSCLHDTVKQLLNLAWFCKKVQIPFDIYAFTNDYWYSKSFDYTTMTRDKSYAHHKQVSGYVNMEENFRLLNMVTSNNRNGKDLEAQLKNFWRLTYGYSDYSRFKSFINYSQPPGYALSGTPLNESVIALTVLIPDFQKRNKVQKTNVVILTDGEAQSINYLMEYKRGSYVKIGRNYIDNDCVLRDRKTGRVYPRFKSSSYQADMITSIFLQCIRDRHPDINLIGIRLISGRNLSNICNNGESKISYENIQKQWKKSKSVELVDFMGYQSLYLMALDNLSSSVDFDVDENATNKQIGAAFTKSLAKKGVNKKMLTSFASLIS